MTLIRIGSSYLNLDQVSEIRDTGIDIEIFFSTETATILRGVDAETFRRWLETAAIDPDPSSRSED